MTFNTYHRHGCRLDGAELDKARAELASCNGDEEAFLALLRSGRTAAVGMALDHYRYADSTSRCFVA